MRYTTELHTHRCKILSLQRNIQVHSSVARTNHANILTSKKKKEKKKKEEKRRKRKKEDLGIRKASKSNSKYRG